MVSVMLDETSAAKLKDIPLSNDTVARSIHNISDDLEDQWTYCVIHREALVSKQLSLKLNEVLKDAVGMVNFIKTRLVKAQMFSALCEEMGAKHTVVLS